MSAQYVAFTPESGSGEEQMTAAVEGRSATSRPIPETGSAGKRDRKGVHECHICHKTYERVDHLHRHISAHDNARSFRCERCPRSFNRSDLLNRHMTIHERGNGNSKAFLNARRKERAAKACQTCVMSKSRCDNEKPCSRCQAKGIECVSSTRPDETAHERSQSTGELSSISQDDEQVYESRIGTSLTSYAPVPVASLLQQSSDRAHFDIPTNAPSMQFPLVASPEQPLYHDSDPASFLDGLWGFSQNVNFHFDNHENEPALDIETFALPEDFWGSDFTSPTSVSNSAPAVPVSKHGHQAFQQSPWLWTPATKDNAYSNQAALDSNNIDATAAMKDLDHLQGFNIIRSPINENTRDKLFSMVLRFHQGNLRTSSFLSSKLLNHLMQVHFVLEVSKIASWIHPPTFRPSKARPELLCSIIASGTNFIAIPAIWKMGLALQEVVRHAVAHLYENDNSYTRDLQALQASLMWLELGLWSGVKRNTEIAESFVQPTLTMFRRGNKFLRGRYSQELITEDIADGKDAVQERWIKWIELETFKRLALQLFLHDMRSSIAFSKCPLMTPTEMTIPLPMSEDMWFAKSASAWSEKYYAKAPAWNALPTLVDLMINPSLLVVWEKFVDVKLCALFVVYGYWSQLWAYQDAKKLYIDGSESQQNAVRRLWLMNQQQELYRDIQSLAMKLPAVVRDTPEIMLMIEYLMMSIHVSSDDLQRFAGKYGEDEATRLTPKIQTWRASPEAHSAIWHAGQIIRCAKAFLPTKLRGFYAIVTYHASMTLWIYGLLNPTTISDAASQGSSAWSSRVILDGEETHGSKMFVSTGLGLPGLLLSDGNFQPLNGSNAVMTAVRDVFHANYPATDESLPPLVEGLGNLMRDLGERAELRYSRSGSKQP